MLDRRLAGRPRSRWHRSLWRSRAGAVGQRRHPPAARPAAKKAWPAARARRGAIRICRASGTTPPARRCNGPPSWRERTCSTTRKPPISSSRLAHGLTRDRRDGGADADVNRAYNEHWMDARRLKITADQPHVADRRSARRPNPAARCRVARAAEGAGGPGGGERAASTPACPTDVSDMSLPVRCIIRTDSPPYLPTIYNNNFQIFQSPGYVVIAPEMIHSARIIPARRPAASRQEPPPVAGRHARPLGRQHAGPRDDEFQAGRGRGVPEREPRDLPHHRTVHARRRRHAQLRVHDRRSGDVDEALDGAASPGRRSIRTSRCTSTPATKTTTTSSTS